MPEILGKCPVCGEEMEITRLACNRCDTKIEGRFTPCKFCRLSAEQREFIEVFIKCRGNIKEVEKELGISYPTVKNKLEDAAAALGYPEQAEQLEALKKKEVLERLSRGEITTEEAVKLLRE